MITRRHCLLAAGAAGLLGNPAARSARAASASAAPLSADERALHALNRLGYGPRPGDAALIATVGLERYVEQQLEPSSLALPPRLRERLAAMDTLDLSQGERLTRYREAQRLNRQAKAEMSDKGDKGDKAMDGGDGKRKMDKGENARRELVRPIVQQASAQRLARALESPAQLEEVLVEFWFNHFNVYAGKGPVSVFVSDYEQRAIRPHVLGSFRAMLGATARHPAMLLYLDNAQSVAPGFTGRGYGQQQQQQQQARGLNENYARELMELHTLGVDGGYSQRDVTELARMLTGWTLDYRGNGQARRQRKAAELFVFDPRRHDAAPKQWLGRPVANLGQAEGEMALDVLAAHPATARHLSYKLAQAFVADAPPPALVARMADSYLASKGNLKSVMRTLLNSEEFWSREHVGAKFKTPYQYVVSSLRAVDAPLPEQLQPLLGALAQAGMPLYGAQTPDGYKNTAAAWMNPEALAQRVQLASTLNQRLRRPGSEALLATLGPTISEGTRKTIAAEPAPIQTALLLGSPDFMRR